MYLGFPCGSAGKESACNAGDLGSVPGLGRSPGEGKGYPLQYSGLENSMGCVVYGVGHDWMTFTFFFTFHRCIYRSRYVVSYSQEYKLEDFVEIASSSMSLRLVLWNSVEMKDISKKKNFCRHIFLNEWFQMWPNELCSLRGIQRSSNSHQALTFLL